MIKGVPAGVNRRAFEAFVAALRSGPLLANGRVIRTWILWDGKAPIAEPTLDDLPAIQLRLLSGPVRRIATGKGPGGAQAHVNESQPQVLIDLAVSGTDQGDLADVAELVTRSLAPTDPAQRAALRDRLHAAGIRDWQLTREILPASAESFDEKAVAGQGAYTLTIQTYS